MRRPEPDFAGAPRADGGGAARAARDLGPARPRGDGDGAARGVHRRRRPQARLRGHPRPDRLGPDDLAAVHGRAHLRGGRGPAGPPRARRRHRLGLPGRRARRARRARCTRSSGCASSPSARARSSTRPGYERVQVHLGDGSLGRPRARALRRDHGRGCRARACRTPSTTSSSPAAGSSSRSATGAASGSRSSSGARRAPPSRTRSSAASSRWSAKRATEGFRRAAAGACLRGMRPPLRTGSLVGRPVVIAGRPARALRSTRSSTVPSARLVGLDVRCGDEAHRFLPFPACEVIERPARRRVRARAPRPASSTSTASAAAPSPCSAASRCVAGGRRGGRRSPTCSSGAEGERRRRSSSRRRTARRRSSPARTWSIGNHALRPAV